jgi:type I restriction enzyme S subunit
MNPVQLLARFDRISEAPDVVPLLRRFILDLAVRGKLVKQDPKDEPAAELLKRIQAEKARIMKAGKIRQEKFLPSVAPDEILFRAPTGWEWVRIRQVMSDRGQITPEQDFTYIDVTAINNEIGCVANPKILSAKDAPSRARKLVRKGDVLYSCVRPYLLNIAVIENEIVPLPIASTAFAVLDGLGMVLSKYLWIALRSPFMTECVEVVMRGQAYPAINESDFSLLSLPLPPLAEQHRIIARVDELLALCDRLEAAQAERESRRDRLTVASLRRLSQPISQGATAVREHARFFLRHLSFLTARPEQVKQLRQTILNLAVRGQLVVQDPSDEPASKLLAKKTKLPDGYQRRRKILKRTSVNVPDGLFPPIPDSWQYANVQTLYDLNVIVDYADGNHGSLYPRSSEFSEYGVTFVTAKDLVGSRVKWDSCAKLKEGRANQLTKGWAQGGDVLLTHNATVGRVAWAEPEVGRFLLGTSVTYYRLNPNIMDPRFFFYMLQSHLWQGQLEAIMAQTTRNQVSIQKQALFWVVVPPLPEQHRIVAKLGELMVLCDRLEKQLTITQTESRHFLEAVLHEALAVA